MAVGLPLLAVLSVIFLLRQFQVMVVENVDDNLKRVVWAFPLYVLLINLFVLPLALGGMLHCGPGRMDPETFVLPMLLSQGRAALSCLPLWAGSRRPPAW